MIRGGVKEIHFGKVISNADPAGIGGLKVQVDTLVDGSVLSDEYIPPTFPFAGKDEGFFFVPKEQSIVEVEVTADPEKATETISAKWRGVLYTDTDTIPTEFSSDPTNRGGIKFGNHTIVFEKAKDLLALISPAVRLGVEAASHPVMRGDTFNTALDTYLTAVDALAQGNITNFGTLAAASTGSLSPLAAGFGAQVTTWTTFKAAAASFKGQLNTWLSTRVKTE